MSAADLVAKSTGAGVQSTAIALLIRDGVLPRPDVAIFADTGWEPKAVYAQVDRLAALYAEMGVEFHRVNQGNLRKDAIDPEHRYASIPYFVRNPDGSDGMGRRQCTSEYKLAPITRKIRESNVPLEGVACDHRRYSEPRYWTGWRPNGEHRLSTVVQVYGNAGGRDEWPAALGVDWMTAKEMTECVPPDYTEHIGAQLLAHLNASAAA